LSPISLDEELKKQGLSWKIKDLSLSGLVLSRYSLEGLSFDRCDCDGIYLKNSILKNVEFLNSSIKWADFSEAKLVHSCMTNCLLKDTSFSNATLTGCSFLGCDLRATNWTCSTITSTTYRSCKLQDAFFWGSRFCKTILKGCHLPCSYWHDTTLKQVTFERCQFEGNAFLGAKVQKSVIKDSTGKDLLFCGTEPSWTLTNNVIPRTDRPVVASLFDSRSMGPMTMRTSHLLAEKDVILLVQATGSPTRNHDQSAKALEKEALSRLQQLSKGPLPSGTRSLADALVAHPKGKETQAIVRKTQELMTYADGLYLAGGNDVEPELYGQKRQPETYCEDTWRRSLSEIAALRAALEKKKGVLGICRGLHIINTYFGGELNQNGRDYEGELHLVTTPSSSQPLVQKLFGGENFQGEDFYGYSCHHQTVSKVGQALEVIFHGEDLIKGIATENGQILGLQFHPEVIAGEELDDFLGDYDDDSDQSGKDFVRYSLKEAGLSPEFYQELEHHWQALRRSPKVSNQLFNLFLAQIKKGFSESLPQPQQAQHRRPGNSSKHAIARV
jgi:putative glutamine amidotransferase